MKIILCSHSIYITTQVVQESSTRLTLVQGCRNQLCNLRLDTPTGIRHYIEKSSTGHNSMRLVC